MKKERQSNIELLRILAILGVIILHYNNPVIGGGITYAEEGSLNFFILYSLESIFACGVDLFIIISGFFMCDSKKKNIWRIIELIIQVVIFQEIKYFLKIALHKASFSIKSALMMLVPTNYFVVLYSVVFIISPFINTLIEKLDDKNYKKLILISMIVFSVIPTLVDVLGEIRGEQVLGLSTVGMYGSQWGYSIVNFLLMYLIGAFLKRGNSILLRQENWKLIVVMIINTVLIIVWARINDRTGFFTERTAWEYCNPLIITEAIILFIMFSRLKLGINKVINRMAEGVFTVFLSHEIFIPHLKIKTFVTGNTFLMVLHVIGCALGLYILGWIVHIIYHWITDPIFRILSTKHAIVLEVDR